MKTLLKFLSLFILLGSNCYSQQSSSIKFIGTANKFQLEGIGNISGNKGDNARLAYWTITDTSTFETKIYIKSLNSGKAGIIVRDANNTNNLQGGRPCYYFYLDKELSKLRLDVRNNENSLLTNIFESTTIVAPVWLSIKKINQTITISYSKEAETVGDVSWINLTTISSINKFSNYVRGVAVASKSTTVKNLAVISNWKESTSNSTFAFNNPFKNVPYETSLEVYSPQKFPNIASILPKSFDPLIGQDFPNWNVLWQVDGLMFKNNNRSITSVGLTANSDYLPNFNNGLGTRCQQFIYNFNFDTGCPWGQTRVNSDSPCTGTITNIDPVCNTTYLNFISTIPFTERYYSAYGTHDSWTSFTNEKAFDEGVNAASSQLYGKGDAVNGKYSNSFSAIDLENNVENGGELLTSVMYGMINGTRGYGISHYSQIFNTLGYIQPSCYPDVNGNYPTADINQSWTNNIKVTIPSRGITNLGLIDNKRIVVGGEVSVLSQSTFYHGTQYDKTGNGNFVTVNKFGNSANVEHYLARLIANLEQQRWYIDHKLDNRKAVILTKIVCDRMSFGLNQNIGETNLDLKFKHIDRRTAFMVGLMTFLNKHEWLIWDRNLSNRNVDGYNGVFGVLNVLNQKKPFGVTSKSATDLYPYMTADLWNTEISYNGISWTKHKGSDIQASSSNLPCRTMSTLDGYWIVGCIRPEKIEPTDVYIRKTIAGVTQVLHITPNMWQSTNPTYANGTVSIPDSDKDYYFNILKVNN